MNTNDTIHVVISPTVEQVPALIDTMAALNQMRNEAECWMFQNHDDVAHMRLEEGGSDAQQIVHDIASVVTMPDLPNDLLIGLLTETVTRHRHHAEVMRQYAPSSPVLMSRGTLTWQRECSAVQIPTIMGPMWVVAQIPDMTYAYHEDAYLTVGEGTWTLLCRFGIQVVQSFTKPEPIPNRWSALREISRGSR